MLFNSFAFLLFLLVVISCFYSTQDFRYRRLVLIIASLAFYGIWSLHYLALLIGSIVVNFAISRRVEIASSRTLWLTIGIAFNLGTLGFFKYADFFIQSANNLGGSEIQPLAIALPLAISFFTFQQIAYLVDMARGKASSSGLLDYMLFVSFFPQLIAGPIVHHREMMPQFKKRLLQSTVAINLTIGLTLFAIGLFKKTILADQFALYGDELFLTAGNGQQPSLAEAWFGSLAYTLQIYFDFSGYCDMALGIARMFGIRLPMNFFSPYKARGIIDFWRRWHITLSRFLRDYLYIPLGGSRKGPLRQYANLAITMLLGGLWHGAGWTFVIWGGLHGFYLVINHAWRRATAEGARLQRLAFAGLVLGPALTFVAVLFAWVIFRAESFDSATLVYTGLIGLSDAPYDAMRLENYKGGKALIWLAAGLLIVWFLPNSLQLMRRYRPAIDSTGLIHEGGWQAGGGRLSIQAIAWRPTAIWALLAGIVASAALLGISDVSPFLYFQF